MPIRKTSNSDPFLNGESALKALQGYVDGTEITRGGMYLLQIINAYIQDGKEISKRLPQEVFGGLPEGGRRHVQASALLRAVHPSGEGERDRVLPSGYTLAQTVLGGWAERDGCWSDTPEGDMLSAGRRFLTSGSEARVYKSGHESRVYKTITPAHYGTTEQLLDRITIHNSIFPETALRVEGYGVMEDAVDHLGFVVIVSQSWVTGRAPTDSEISEGLARRGLVEPDGSVPFGFVSTPSGLTVLNDIHELNSVTTESGKLMVFDCVAAPNVFGVEGKRHIIPELTHDAEAVNAIRAQVDSLLPKEMSIDDLMNTLTESERVRARNSLESLGRYSGPDGTVAQACPERPGKALVSSRKRIRSALEMTKGITDSVAPLTDTEKETLSAGGIVKRGNTALSFSLDRGRVQTMKGIMLTRKRHAGMTASI